MFLRFTYLYFAPEKQAEAKNIYMTEIAPVIARQIGNNQVLLLEPKDNEEEFISFSLWEHESDLRNFETSADYPPVIGRIKEMVCRPPVQKYYVVNS